MIKILIQSLKARRRNLKNKPKLKTNVRIRRVNQKIKKK
jgi:hypothetical protein